MADYNRLDRTNGDYERGREDSFERWAQQNSRRQSDHLHSDYRNRANMSESLRPDYEHRDRNRADRYRGNPGREEYRDELRYEPTRQESDHDANGRTVWSRSIDEVRSWFGDEEAERRRRQDEEERMRNDRIGAYHNHAYRDDNNDRNSRGWDSSRGYGSNLNRDYEQAAQHRHQTNERNNDDSRFFRSSNHYGGSRNTDFYRDYPTHNQGRSSWNNEDDEMKHGYDSQFDYHDTHHDRMFGGRTYERNYPTRAERDTDHQHDLSGGWQSSDSHRGYRSLNNTGRSGIGQDNRLGTDRDPNPNYRDQNYSRGNYAVNLNAGGQEYTSRHYDDRGRPGTRINEYAQRGYSEGYGRSGYSTSSQTGYYTDSNLARPVDSVSGKAPKNYKGAEERIYVEVCEALSREIDASEIEVKCSNNEITLTGSVSSREDKRRAERITERVQGVEDVHNQLTVKQAEASHSTSLHGTSEPDYPTNRATAQPANSSRTDLATDSSSETSGDQRASSGKTNGTSGSLNGGTGSANGSGANSSSRGSARR
jgi:osmotically-inducible protein OsmY